MIAGPKKLDAIAIRDTRAIPTDGAIPGTLIAAKLKAGKNGPMQRPVIISEILSNAVPSIVFLDESGTPTINPAASESPAIYPPYWTVF